jgi:hypothetical protein
MYLHNVYEAQSAVLPEDIFQKRLTKAFEFLVCVLSLYRNKQELIRRSNTTV